MSAPRLLVKSPKPARFPAYSIESEAGEVLATVPITASGDSHRLALAMAAAPNLLAVARILDCIASSPRFKAMEVSAVLAELESNGVWIEPSAVIALATGAA